jgi:sRNA-binding carbon storage regulator CsrA
VLVVQRKPGEAVVLFLPDGSRVRVTYRGLRGGTPAVPRVSLGVDAGKGVPVWRGELLERDAGGTLRVRLPRGGRAGTEG